MKVSITLGERVREANFIKTDLFCPHCGSKSVWEDTDPGDYYVGREYICTSCDNEMHLDPALYNVNKIGKAWSKAIKEGEKE